MKTSTFVIDVFEVAGIGWAADVIRIRDDWRDGERLHTTRIYHTPEDAVYVARQFVLEYTTGPREPE
jgi:hypothetical protein